jgi:hypothetical protein
MCPALSVKPGLEVGIRDQRSEVSSLLVTRHRSLVTLITNAGNSFKLPRT